MASEANADAEPGEAAARTGTSQSSGRRTSGTASAGGASPVHSQQSKTQSDPPGSAQPVSPAKTQRTQASTGPATAQGAAQGAPPRPSSQTAPHQPGEPSRGQPHGEPSRSPTAPSTPRQHSAPRGTPAAEPHSSNSNARSELESRLQSRLSVNSLTSAPRVDMHSLCGPYGAGPTLNHGPLPWTDATGFAMPLAQSHTASSQLPPGHPARVERTDEGRPERGSILSNVSGACRRRTPEDEVESEVRIGNVSVRRVFGRLRNDTGSRRSPSACVEIKKTALGSSRSRRPSASAAP